MSWCARLFFLGCLVWLPFQSVGAVDFNRDIRPILSDNCFACHGPDDKERKAKLRLDQKSDALVAGKPGESEAFLRMTTNDPDDRMPPPKTGKTLTAEQIDLVRRWIAEGAEYKTHWAFVRPEQVALPKLKDEKWPRNAIDHFILARLEAEGLKPSARADDYTLIRRVYLDLIGLPPTPDEVDAYLKDESADRFERLVDALLDSPHYGERWARRWLDIARYADTNGYEKDRPRSIWPYRDWVIKALNDGMPFDQFTIEQIAGDMLPNATVAQRVATGFHRNTMLNEEGGIDPLEFRFHAMTDRVSTTGEAWLGLTMGCAQCHTHKYDPVTQKEYYQFMAFLNNADEPVMDVLDPDVTKRRKAIERKVKRLTALLPSRFPVGQTKWESVTPASVISKGGATVEKQGDGSFLFSGKTPERDTYEVVIKTDAKEIRQIRLEAMADDRLPSKGPGRTSHGNFVLTEVTLSAAPKGAPDKSRTIKIASAVADAEQDGFGAAKSIDGEKGTGWGIHVEGVKNWNVTRAVTFTLQDPIKHSQGAELTLRLSQDLGTKHTMGRIRFQLGTPDAGGGPLEVQRERLVEKTFKAWRKREAARVIKWKSLRPTEAKANMPLLTILDDDSVFASGDQTKRDVYEVKFEEELSRVTAIRLEAMTDERLPRHGPGRVYYEGPIGDFTLTDFKVLVNGKPVKLSGAAHSYASGKFKSSAAIDDHPQTGWSVNGGQGKPHNAVFRLAEPLENVNGFSLKMVFERHYSAGLGRFRVSVTSEDGAVAASRVPTELERLLSLPDRRLQPHQEETLFEHFLMVTPELAGARAEIDQLRKSMPKYPTTLVMAERPSENPRPTHVHRRGEFLQPTDVVAPAPLSVLPGLPEGASANRLAFARWLVSPENPLVGRVTINRQWAAFFGEGLVRTVRDFGFQGEPPSHPELLDWLSVEFVKQGWSMKAMHKLIVMSATYQQSSRVSEELNAKDPKNELLARGPRVRLEAELIRDAALRYSGLLTTKLGGPSVFPPQPSNVTTEGAYGRLAWKVSTGPDRYRRGLYTYVKRTTPFALYATFDAPSGEACVIQREVSNTPLQALTLLNDQVFVEAAQELGRVMTAREGSLEQRVEHLFRRCLTRKPNAEERGALLKFMERQKKRFASGELDAGKVAGDGKGDVNERAAWTALARALFNLDESIVKG